MKSLISLLAGAVVLVLAANTEETRQFWHSFLVAFLFVSSICLGALFFVLVHYLARAGWHVVLRRQAENTMGAIPALALLMIPLTMNLEHVYPWVTEASEHKASYLNARAFLTRTFIYLVGWILIAWWFRRESVKQDESADSAITRRLQKLSAPALIFLGFSMTFAAFDWLMSLEPHWYSSIFGVYFFAGSTLSYFAFQALVSMRVSERLSLEHFHGIGKLLFGFLCFWAYIAFSQYLLIWYANIPEETLWYHHRFQGTWLGLSFILAAGHFVLPFFFFLPVRTKKTRSLLALGSAWILLMHYLDLFWIVMPNLHPDGVMVHWLDLATLGGAVSILIGAMGFLSSRAAHIPVSDPRLEESLAFDNK